MFGIEDQMKQLNARLDTSLGKADIVLVKADDSLQRLDRVAVEAAALLAELRAEVAAYKAARERIAKGLVG